MRIESFMGASLSLTNLVLLPRPHPDGDGAYYRGADKG